MKQPLSPDIAQELLHAVAEAAVVTDDTGSIIFVNEEAEKLFGYEPGEILGKPVEVLMPEANRDRHEHFRKAYGRAPRSRPLLSGLELFGRRKDGTVFRAEIALKPIRREDGLLIASTIRAIEAGDAPDAYFRTLLESAPDAMIIVDEKGRIAIVNAQAERMFGYRRDELLGNRIEMLLPERLRERHVSHRLHFTEAPELRPMGADFKLVGLRKDGSEFPVEISLSPVVSSGSQFVSSLIRDVTERKRMEDELISARQAAERATRANNAFLAAASHDLRQPVQALSLLTGALRRTIRDERALQMIESQENSLQAMTNLLNSLLDISRLDGGAVAPDFEEFPVQRLIDRLSTEFTRQARTKGLRFAAEACDAVVRSDPNLLTEIIQNLVSNAIRYTDAGSVRMRCRRTGDTCRLDVIDTGIGIEADQLEVIFTEFHQVKSGRGRREGFGLGLAIVRRLADLLGHEITVSSTPGKGSRFSVSLPVVDGENVSAAPDDSARQRVPRGAGLVVLIEDDTSVANAWEMLLEAEGYGVARAASLTEVRALLPKLGSKPAVVISDYHLLDDSTGVEAVAALRRYFDEEIPAFIVSGDTSKIVRDARTLANCTTMSKPVDTGQLLAAVERAARNGSVGDS